MVDYRLNELSARELSALTLVEAGVAVGWIVDNWPGLLAEVHRLLPDLAIAPSDMDGKEMLDRALALAHIATAGCRPTAGHAAPGVHRPAGHNRQTASHLRSDALDHNAKAASAAVLRSRRRRRRSAQSESPAAEPSAGQRSGHHTRTPSRHPVSGVERMDRASWPTMSRCSNARIRAGNAIRSWRRPICGSGSPSTHIAP